MVQSLCEFGLPFLHTHQRRRVQCPHCEQSFSVRWMLWRSECQRSEKRMATLLMGSASGTTPGQTVVIGHVTALMALREVGGDTSWGGKDHTTMTSWKISASADTFIFHVAQCTMSLVRRVCENWQDLLANISQWGYKGSKGSWLSTIKGNPHPA